MNDRGEYEKTAKYGLTLLEPKDFPMPEVLKKFYFGEIEKEDVHKEIIQTVNQYFKQDSFKIILFYSLQPILLHYSGMVKEV